jgi:hypothetical protein
VIGVSLVMVLAALRLPPAPAGPTRVAHADSLPAWAAVRWDAAAFAKHVVRNARITPDVQRGDFDHDGREDVAVFVEHRTTHRQGILFLHGRAGVDHLIGAGREFGNGGDSFDWMDEWHVEHRAGRADVLIIGREGSASAAVVFKAGRYRWVQRGD